MGKTSINSLREIYTGKMLPLDQLRNLQKIFREIDYQMVGVISAAESSQTALVHLDKSIKNIKSLWKDISPALTNEGTLKEHIKTVNNNLNKFWELSPRLRNAYKADSIDDVDMIHEEWRPLKKEIFSAIDKLAETQKEVTSQFFNSQNNLVNKISTVLLFVLLGSILGFIAFTFFITRSIKRPVTLVVESAQKIADGDLTVRIPVTGRDEMGVMGDALNRMIERLNTLFGTISSNVTLLNRQSETLSSATSEMLNGATLQYNQIEQVASATEEMS
ncbi:MAG: methyl-accepting chemotaxis protein, partial [Nitrospirae bacterium]